MTRLPLPYFLAFALSGASGLAFEIVAQRSLFLLLGASAPAVSAILMGFFAGVAAGGYLGGILLSRVRNPSRVYVAVEGWILLWVALTPTLFRELSPWLLRWLPAGHAPVPVTLSLRMLSATLMLLPATVGMGATIPVMNRLCVAAGESVGGGVARAYGANAAGAVVGCLTAGFWLIPRLGMADTFAFAAACNGAAVMLVLWQGRRTAAVTGFFPMAPRTPRSGALAGTVATESAVLPSKMLLVGVYVLGAVLLLGYEVAGFRVLGIYASNSIVTFTLLLATYLSGIAAGSLLVYPLIRRWTSPVWILFGANVGTAAAVLLSLPVIYRLPQFTYVHLTRLATAGELTHVRFVAVELAYSLLVGLLPAVFSGMAYPALCDAVVGRRDQVGQQSGVFYALGTAGSVVGVLIVGTVAIPAAGLVATLAGLCATSSLLGLFVVTGDRSLARVPSRVAAVATVALLCGAALYGATGAPMVRSGKLTARSDGRLVIRRAADPVGVTRELLHHAEGPTASVSVEEISFGDGRRPVRILELDGQAVASTDLANRADAKMLAHLPLMLHPNPRRALTVGFGSGGTSWSMTRYGVEVECVEIEAEVPRAAEWFRSQNNGVLGEERFRLFINDARDHLAAVDSTYDVIVTDVTNVQYKQNGSLYTREYFQQLRSRLMPGGIGCVWAPMSGLSEADFKTLLATFASVFPRSYVWYVNHTLSKYVLIVGAKGALRVDPERLHDCFADPAVRDDLADIRVVSPEQIASFLLLDPEGVRRYAAGADLHTDDLPVLEFASIYSGMEGDRHVPGTLRGMLAHAPPGLRPELPDGWQGDPGSAERFWSASRSLTAAIAHTVENRHLRDVERRKRGMDRAAELVKTALRQVGPQGVDPQLLETVAFRHDRSTVEHYFAVRERSFGPEGGVGVVDAYGLATEFASAGRVFYPRVGTFRPPDHDLERLAAWVRAVYRFTERSGVEQKAGRAGSDALVIRGTDRVASAGLFTPVLIGDRKRFKIAALVKGDLENGDVGIGIIEYSLAAPSPEQFEERIHREHFITARQYIRSLSFEDWQPIEFEFVPQDQAEMFHLVLYVEGTPTGGAVVFDELEVQAIDPA